MHLSLFWITRFNECREEVFKNSEHKIHHEILKELVLVPSECFLMRERSNEIESLSCDRFRWQVMRQNQ
jgi:hypothetical protein